MISASPRWYTQPLGFACLGIALWTHGWGCGRSDWWVGIQSPPHSTTLPERPGPPPAPVLVTPPPREALAIVGNTLTLSGRCHASANGVRLYRHGEFPSLLVQELRAQCGSDGSFADTVTLSEPHDTYALGAYNNYGLTVGRRFEIHQLTDSFSEPRLRTDDVEPMPFGSTRFAVDTTNRIWLASRAQASTWGKLRTHYGPPDALTLLPDVQLGSAYMAGYNIEADAAARGWVFGAVQVVTGNLGLGNLREDGMVANFQGGSWLYLPANNPHTTQCNCNLDGRLDHLGRPLVVFGYTDVEDYYWATGHSTFVGGASTSPLSQLPDLPVTAVALAIDPGVESYLVGQTATGLALYRLVDTGWELLDQATTTVTLLQAFVLPGQWPTSLVRDNTQIATVDFVGGTLAPVAAPLTDARTLSSVVVDHDNVYAVLSALSDLTVLTLNAAQPEWTPLWAQPDITPAMTMIEPSLKVGGADHELFLGWSENDIFRLQRLTDQGFVDVLNTQEMRVPSVATLSTCLVDADDALWVVYFQKDTVYVDGWDGSQWRQYSPGIPTPPDLWAELRTEQETHNALPGFLLTTSTEGHNRIYRFVDGTVIDLGDLGSDSRALALADDSDGPVALVATYRTGALAGGDTVTVMRHSGAGWLPLSGDLRDDTDEFASAGQLFKDSAGRWVAAWLENGARELRVFRLDAGNWQALNTDMLPWGWRTQPHLRELLGDLLLLDQVDDVFVYEPTLWSWSQETSTWDVVGRTPINENPIGFQSTDFSSSLADFSSLTTLGENAYVAVKEVDPNDTQLNMTRIYRLDAGNVWNGFATTLEATSYGTLHSSETSLYWCWGSNTLFGGMQVRRVPTL